MTIAYPNRNTHWPLWQRVLFRFVFIYWVLYCFPAQWFEETPYLNILYKWYVKGNSWVVGLANKYLLHVKDELVPISGSGDTSFAWAQLYFYLIIALAGALIWSVLHRNRQHHNRLFYWLLLLLRYNLIFYCLYYGIVKMFLMQMPFPDYNAMSTPLGNLSPMRLTWYFIGYSAPYQFFCGFFEFIAGFLLLFRRTITIGLVVSIVAFVHVVLLNFCYDIPVKLLSLHLLLQCLFLLVPEHKRFTGFFLNRSTTPSQTFHITLNIKWMRFGRLLLKGMFIFLFIGLASYKLVKEKIITAQKTVEEPGIIPGKYNVQIYLVNNEPRIAPADSLRRSIIFRPNRTATFNIMDSLFFNKEALGFFYFTPDTNSSKIKFKLAPTRSDDAFVLKYQTIGANRLVLDGWVRKDSLHIELERDMNQFKLFKKPFHWMSETVP